MGKQNFSFMIFLREKIISGEKTRTNRPFSEFRDKCNIGDIMHIFINLRTPNREKIFDAKVINKILWNILNAPICKDKLAKTIESPKPKESWYDFAIKDGFNCYIDFLEYFIYHRKKSKEFIFFEFEKLRDYQRTLTNYIQV